jgi:2-phospho-L-lactate guanylyltransferase
VNDTGIWAVIPVRSWHDGKQRLAPTLDNGQRAALVQWLLTHTLDQAMAFPGSSRTLVVTACDEVSARVGDLGIRVLRDAAPGGLNNALRQAQRALVALGAIRMLVVSSDLPLLTSDDLRLLADAASDGVLAIAPDRADQGTNAMCLPVSRPFDFAFGPDSFTRHRECAQLLGLERVIVRSRGLAFDVDLPSHLSELKEIISLLQASHSGRESDPPDLIGGWVSRGG